MVKAWRMSAIQLGHSSIQITVALYGHLVPGATAGCDRRDARCSAANPSGTPPTP
jgi:hypothetical protein